MRPPARAPRGLAVVVGLAIVAVSAGPAWASFHLTKVVEVFPGTPASPQAQYIELQAYSSSQNFVGGHMVSVFDAGGAMITSFTLTQVTNGTNQAHILIATAQAQTFFNVTADATMTASLPLAGGKVCFDTFDCVAWGNYVAGDTAVGTP